MATKIKTRVRKPPTKLGKLIDELYSLRQERLQAQKTIDAMKENERKIEDRLLNDFDRAELSKASGKLATVSVKTKIVPNVEDWDKVYGYILKHKAFELLHKRVHAGAWNERREQGEEVPGTVPFHSVEISVRKVGGS